MVNNLVLLINLIGLLLMDSFLVTAPTITQNIPTTMTPGSEVRVTVDIEKGDLGGFAKLQLDLPQGLSITALETKGASFTFADQKAKFIWMALPSAPTFKITYTLKADASASGVQRINGRLSYIDNNERKTYEVPTSTVDLGTANGDAVAQTAFVDEEDEVVDAGDLASAAGGAPIGNIVMAEVEVVHGTAAIQGAGGVTGIRTITPITESEMLVEVTVNKGAIRGFGKLQETLPQGFTAVEKESDEAIFTAQDRVVKFVWLNLPARNIVKVVYKLRADTRPHGQYSIDGEFGYLLNDETQKAVLATSRFYTGPKAFELMAEDKNTMDPLDNPEARLALEEKERIEAERKAQQESEDSAAEAERRERERTPDDAVSTTPQKTTPRIPAPEKGVTYKVQISAGHREVGRTYFQTRHRYTGDFSIERHQGWIKYVTGATPTYKEARDLRVSLVQAGHQFPGPFVTAYNNGERITVQEALMLSNQQWVQ